MHVAVTVMGHSNTSNNRIEECSALLHISPLTVFPSLIGASSECIRFQCSEWWTIDVLEQGLDSALMKSKSESKKSGGDELHFLHPEQRSSTSNRSSPCTYLLPIPLAPITSCAYADVHQLPSLISVPLHF